MVQPAEGMADAGHQAIVAVARMGKGQGWDQ
jgi:hypothetical protein